LGKKKLGKTLVADGWQGPSIGSLLEGRHGSVDWRGPDEDRSCK
jgi:hypothetical protein